MVTQRSMKTVPIRLQSRRSRMDLEETHSSALAYVSTADASFKSVLTSLPGPTATNATCVCGAAGPAARRCRGSRRRPRPWRRPRVSWVRCQQSRGTAVNRLGLKSDVSTFRIRSGLTSIDAPIRMSACENTRPLVGPFNMAAFQNWAPQVDGTHSSSFQQGLGEAPFPLKNAT